jgi:hypothetical protein
MLLLVLVLPLRPVTNGGSTPQSVKTGQAIGAVDSVVAVVAAVVVAVVAGGAIGAVAVALVHDDDNCHCSQCITVLRCVRNNVVAQRTHL